VIGKEFGFSVEELMNFNLEDLNFWADQANWLNRKE